VTPVAPASDIEDEPDDDLSEYRKHLLSVDQKSQEEFDKTVLSLSGGALGISFVFLKDVIGPNPIVDPNLLFIAWVAWGSSTFCVLLSYYLSHLALRKTIRQVDARTLRTERPGGRYSVAISVLNPVGAILFLLGVCTITLFANANLKLKGATNVATQSTAASTPASPPSPASSASSAAATGGKR
jgi:hypothetical protein